MAMWFELLYIQQGYILFTFLCLSTYSLESDDSRQSLDYLETVLLLLEVVYRNKEMSIGLV